MLSSPEYLVRSFLVLFSSGKVGRAVTKNTKQSVAVVVNCEQKKDVNFPLLTRSSGVRKKLRNLVWSDELNVTGLPDADQWRYQKGYMRTTNYVITQKAGKKNAGVKNRFLHIMVRHDALKMDGKGERFLLPYNHNSTCKRGIHYKHKKSSFRKHQTAFFISRSCIYCCLSAFMISLQNLTTTQTFLQLGLCHGHKYPA